MVHTDVWEDWEINHCQLPEGTKWHIQNQHGWGHLTSRSLRHARRMSAGIFLLPIMHNPDNTSVPLNVSMGVRVWKQMTKISFVLKYLHFALPQGFTLRFVMLLLPCGDAASHFLTSTLVHWLELRYGNESELGEGQEQNRLNASSTSVQHGDQRPSSTSCPWWMLKLEWAVTAARSSRCQVLPGAIGTGQQMDLGTGSAEKGCHSAAGWARSTAARHRGCDYDGPHETIAAMVDWRKTTRPFLHILIIKNTVQHLNKRRKVGRKFKAMPSLKHHLVRSHCQVSEITLMKNTGRNSYFYFSLSNFWALIIFESIFKYNNNSSMNNNCIFVSNSKI